MKILGWVFSIIGGIMSINNASTYITLSDEIQAWYYYRAELESARTFLIVGLIMLVIGVIILINSREKNNNGRSF